MLIIIAWMFIMFFAAIGLYGAVSIAFEDGPTLPLIAGFVLLTLATVVVIS